MSRLLSAIILSGSLVVGAFLMRPPRYEVVHNEWLESPVEQVPDIRQFGVFDRQTGELCYRYFGPNDDFQMVEFSPANEDDWEILGYARCALP